MKKECKVRRARAFGQFCCLLLCLFGWLVSCCFVLVNLVFLDGLLFDLFYLGQYFFGDNFPNTMTTESWEQCSRKNGQIAEEKVVNDRSDICKRDETTSS